MWKIPLILFMLFSASTYANPAWTTYRNKEFGLSIAYPKNLKISNKFVSTYHLNNAWSAGSAKVTNPMQYGRHKIAEITLYNTSNNKNGYYYVVTVRIGASSNPKDIASCYSTAQYSVNGTISNLPSTVTINHRLFQPLPMTGGGGMTQFFNGTSYRTKANGFCYAIEYIQSGGYLSLPKGYHKLVKHYRNLAERIIHTVKIRNNNST